MAHEEKGPEAMLLTFIENAAGQRWNLLNMNGRKLAQYPHIIREMFLLSHLKELSIKSNLLVSISADIRGLTSLQSLDMSRNRIESLPTDLSALTRLTTLKMGDNCLCEFPPTLTLRRLQRLIAPRNRLRMLPHTLPSSSGLTELDLSGNRFVVVPAEIGRFTSLTRLALASNPIHGVSASVIAPLASLTHLDVSSCENLVALPGAIASLQFLAELDAHDCPRLTIPLLPDNVENDISAAVAAARDYFAGTDCDADADAAVLSAACAAGAARHVSEKPESEREEHVQTGRHHRPHPSMPTPGERGSRRKQVGPWAIRKLLGQGEYSKVKLAHHMTTGESVAIKIVKRHRLRDNKVLERLQREILVGLMMRHPNIISVREVHIVDGTYFIVMDHARGGELLEHLLERGSQIQESEARRIFVELVRAVEYVHACGIAHRDMKLENIMFDGDGHIRVCDFGMCNIEGDDEAQMQSSCGSPLYAAPELLSGHAYRGCGVDIWALGIILYCLVCGFFPFDDPIETKLFDKIRSGKYPTPFGSRKVRDLIGRILLVDPSTRCTLAEIKNHPWLADQFYPPRRSPRGADKLPAGYMGPKVDMVRLVYDRLKRNGGNTLTLLGPNDFDADGIEATRRQYTSDPAAAPLPPKHKHIQRNATERHHDGSHRRHRHHRDRKDAAHEKTADADAAVPAQQGPPTTECSDHGPGRLLTESDDGGDDPVAAPARQRSSSDSAHPAARLETIKEEEAEDERFLSREASVSEDTRTGTITDDASPPVSPLASPDSKHEPAADAATRSRAQWFATHGAAASPQGPRAAAGAGKTPPLPDIGRHMSSPASVSPVAHAVGARYRARRPSPLNPAHVHKTNASPESPLSASSAADSRDSGFDAASTGAAGGLLLRTTSEGGDDSAVKPLHGIHSERLHGLPPTASITPFGERHNSVGSSESTSSDGSGAIDRPPPSPQRQPWGRVSTGPFGSPPSPGQPPPASSGGLAGVARMQRTQSAQCVSDVLPRRRTSASLRREIAHARTAKSSARRPRVPSADMHSSDDEGRLSDASASAVDADSVIAPMLGRERQHSTSELPAIRWRAAGGGDTRAAGAGRRSPHLLQTPPAAARGGGPAPSTTGKSRITLWGLFSSKQRNREYESKQCDKERNRRAK